MVPSKPSHHASGFPVLRPSVSLYDSEWVGVLGVQPVLWTFKPGKPNSPCHFFFFFLEIILTLTRICPWRGGGSKVSLRSDMKSKQQKLLTNWIVLVSGAKSNNVSQLSCLFSMKSRHQLSTPPCLHTFPRRTITIHKREAWGRLHGIDNSHTILLAPFQPLCRKRPSPTSPRSASLYSPGWFRTPHVLLT